MEQVTSFSASLLQSLGGDTEEAARIADQAIIDMADNANTFGTSIDSIQAAYQGFAKQNYTMLDNLKLGYGGTKTEMERLLKDAEKLSGVKYDISNLNDVYEAIHVIQEEMNIAGTTAKEAEQTLTGSIASLQASWQNFLSGTGNLGDVVKSARTAFNNVLRIVKDAIPDIMENIYDWLPELIQLAADMLGAITESIMENMPMLIQMTLDILGTIGQALLDNLPMIIEMGMTILLGLITGLTENMDTLIPKIVEITLLIVDTLIDHLPELTIAGVQLLVAIITGIVKAIPQLIEKIPEIVTKIIDAYKEFFPQLFELGKDLLKQIGDGLKAAVFKLLIKIGEIGIDIYNKFKEGFTNIIDSAKNWGRDMIMGFVNGIKEKIDALKEGVTSVANVISEHLHFSRPDVGPLRDYEQWLPDMIEGMSKSLDKSAPTLLGKISDLAAAMSMSPTLNGNVNSIGPSVNVIVNSNYEQDPLGQMVSSIKTFSNGAKNDYNYGYGG